MSKNKENLTGRCPKGLMKQMITWWKLMKFPESRGEEKVQSIQEQTEEHESANQLKQL